MQGIEFKEGVRMTLKYYKLGTRFRVKAKETLGLCLFIMEFALSLFQFQRILGHAFAQGTL